MDARTSDRITDLLEINGKLVGENLRLQYENRTLRAQVDELRDKTKAYWDCVEAVACGETIDCVTCGQPKPCQCDTR
jgi:regulator of replication initiation timing